jgi:hypothetical protein
MPITRTPIIDDDGTGTTGTVIDNAWKTELYNQIDALAGTAWVAIPFNVADFWTGVTAGAVSANYYTILNAKTLIWILAVYNVPLPPGGGAYLSYRIPAGRSIFASNAAMGKASLATDNGVEVPGIMVASNLGPTYLAVCKSNFSAWAGPNVTTYFTATIGLT